MTWGVLLHGATVNMGHACLGFVGKVLAYPGTTGFHVFGLKWGLPVNEPTHRSTHFPKHRCPGNLVRVGTGTVHQLWLQPHVVPCTLCVHCLGGVDCLRVDDEGKRLKATGELTAFRRHPVKFWLWRRWPKSGIRVALQYHAPVYITRTPGVAPFASTPVMRQLSALCPPMARYTYRYKAHEADTGALFPISSMSALNVSIH